ncbi:MAG: hypothetical protein ACYCRF_04800, partial [Acidithiobacillus sp.]
MIMMVMLALLRRVGKPVSTAQTGGAIHPRPEGRGFPRFFWVKYTLYASCHCANDDFLSGVGRLAAGWLADDKLVTGF